MPSFPGVFPARQRSDDCCENSQRLRRNTMEPFRRGAKHMSLLREQPGFTLGVEEEYLLVDAETLELSVDPPDGFMPACQKQVSGQVVNELMRAQVETATKVCENVAEVRQELTRQRREISAVAEQFGLRIIAASTHPSALWREQKQTPSQRYVALQKEMQATARRMLICGMHVHVGIEDQDLRVDLMNQFRYFLPHLLALSVSSPFWEGDDTGLHSFRLTIFSGLPRTGLPEEFNSWSDYERHIDTLVRAKVIEDSSMIWWDVRPSARFPTLETRICDLCTFVEDTVCLTAFCVCLLRMLWRLRISNSRWRSYNLLLLEENRWRAMRYGPTDSLLDFGKGTMVPFSELLDELIALVRQDMEYFDCKEEVEHARTIIRRGTSASMQLAVYRQALEEGASEPEALREVVRFLVEATMDGC